jgi:7-cyano-7-deazaguanine synthase
MRERVLVLLSGGIDSAVCLAHELSLRHEVDIVHFDYGSKQGSREFVATYGLCDHYGIGITERWMVDVKRAFGLICNSAALMKGGKDVVKGKAADDEAQEAMVVPFRNGVFLAMAAALAVERKCTTIVAGLHGGNEAVYPDISLEFKAAMNEAIRVGTAGRVQFRASFVGLSKARIILEGESLMVPWELTYSCYEGGKVHCGECGACLSRIAAFVDAGVEDPTVYAK